MSEQHKALNEQLGVTGQLVPPPPVVPNHFLPGLQVLQTSNSKLYQALIKAQAEIRSISKNRDNPFFGSKYSDLDAVVEAIREPFAKHDLGFYQDVSADLQSVTCVTHFIHSSGERMSSSPLRLPVAANNPQAFGSAATYAKRFSLQGFAGITSKTDDDDANAASGRTVERRPEERPAAEPTRPAFAPPVPPVAHAGNAEPSRERPAAVTFRFGGGKGKTSHDVSEKDLNWYLGVLNESAADPKKARFAESNRREAALLQAELRWREQGNQ